MSGVKPQLFLRYFQPWSGSPTDFTSGSGNPARLLLDLSRSFGNYPFLPLLKAKPQEPWVLLFRQTCGAGAICRNSYMHICSKNICWDRIYSVPANILTANILSLHVAQYVGNSYSFPANILTNCSKFSL